MCWCPVHSAVQIRVWKQFVDFDSTEVALFYYTIYLHDDCYVELDSRISQRPRSIEYINDHRMPYEEFRWAEAWFRRCSTMWQCEKWTLINFLVVANVYKPLEYHPSGCSQSNKTRTLPHDQSWSAPHTVPHVRIVRRRKLVDILVSSVRACRC